MIASEGCSICNGHFVQVPKWYGIIRNTDAPFYSPGRTSSHSTPLTPSLVYG